jgi:iron complex outermembrane recepter protein
MGFKILHYSKSFTKMGKLILMLGVWFIPFLCQSQNSHSADSLYYTVHLKEVEITTSLPLNNNNVMDFYRSNHFSTLDNINARLDGMSLIRRGSYALEPQLSGFSGGQLNLTIDGMKMFGACTDKMDPITSYIEPSNLKKITIDHGTTGCETGCNIGGSVDMTLQEPEINSHKPIISTVEMGYESVTAGRNFLFASGYSAKKWAWEIDGVYRKNSNYMDGNNKVIPFSQFQKTNLHSVFKYQPNSRNSFKADLLYDAAQNVGYPALTMDVGVAKATLIALEYQRMGKTQIKAKMYVNTIYHVMDDSKRDSLHHLSPDNGMAGKTVFMRMEMPGKSSTIGSYAQILLPWNKQNRLMVKADNYTNSSIAEMTMHMRYPGLPPEPPMYMQTWPEMVRNVSGLFIQNTSFVSPNLTFTIDGRVDYNLDILQSNYAQQQFSVFNYNLPKKQGKFLRSFNLSAQYRLVNNLSLVATTGYSERMPTIGERLGFYLFNAYDGYDYIGNPYLNVEKSNFFRVAFLLSTSKIKINLSQSVSMIHDYIMGVTDNQIPAMNFYAKGTRVTSNIPEAQLYSTDLQLFFNPDQNLSFFILSKFTVGEISSSSPMPLIPPLKNIAAVQYQKDHLLLQGECESSMAQGRINVNYGEQRTSAYTVFNFKSGYKFPFSKTDAEIGFSISNLLNKVYYEHLDWGRINRPGRNISVSLTLKY